MATTENGWEAIPDYGDPRLGTLHHVAGSGNIRSGEVLTTFSLFCDDYVKNIEPIDKADSWGYAPRTIHGSKTLSNHASGTAIDINVGKYPQFKNAMPSDKQVKLRTLLKSYPVIRWGGDYPAARLDQMHFEIVGSPEALSNWLKARLNGGTVTKMVSPVEGRVTSEYGKRNGTLHAGIDIATNGKPGVVRAAFAGRLSNLTRGRVLDRTTAQSKNKGKAVVAPGRTGNGVRVKNNDGETQIYIHVDVLSKWKNGDWVNAGDVLGYTDLSGNTSGYHLHFETWTKDGYTRNPRIYFQYHGITPGKASSAPAPAPVPAPSKPSPAKDANVVAVQNYLKQTGYYKGIVDGIRGNMTIDAVKRYQSVQNHNGDAKLVVDGDWGNVTQKWKNWVVQAQKAANRFRAVHNQVVADGDYGPKFKEQVKTIQSRNGLVADGILGNKTAAWMRLYGATIENRP